MSRVLVVAIAVIFAGGVGWFFLSGGAAAQSSETTPIRTIRAGQTVSFTAPLPSSEDRRLCDGATWNASEQRCYFGPQNSFRATSCLAPYRRSWGNDHVSEIEVTNGGSATARPRSPSPAMARAQRPWPFSPAVQSAAST